MDFRKFTILNPKAIKMRRPLVQNRNEENGRSPFSEWRFPPVRPCRVSETKPAGRPAGLFVSVSQSVSQSVSVSKTFVNSSGSAKPIRTGQTPKDAPEIGNDDGVVTWRHVSRVTRHVPPRKKYAKKF